MRTYLIKDGFELKRNKRKYFGGDPVFLPDDEAMRLMAMGLVEEQIIEAEVVVEEIAPPAEVVEKPTPKPKAKPKATAKKKTTTKKKEKK
jgi:hypothetical protein